MEALGTAAPARPPPPASAAAVAALPRRALTAAGLAAPGGGDARCPVCLCLGVGDAVLELPCSHVAHEACLGPWLARTNTCPECRFELPTGNEAHDRQRARERAAAATARAAACAVPAGEFLYI
jgi:hypothetical protein